MPTGDINIGDSRRIWNSTFKVKPPKPQKARKPLRRSAWKRTKPKATKPRIKANKPQLEAWIKAIPESQSHGSGTLQKRLWRLTSDFVRIRDWYRFDGRCIATGVKIGHWSEGQAGHFKAYSVCRGIYKFCTDNIHLQSEVSNKWNNSDTWFNFAAEMERRWGYTKVSIDQCNLDTDLKSLGVENVKEKMRDTLKRMADLPEQPEYFGRATSLLAQLESAV